MTRPLRRFPLLIAVSLLTAGIAVAGTAPSLASEPAPPYDERDEEAPRNLTLEGQVTNASSGEPVADVQLLVYNVWTSEDGDVRGRERLTRTTDEAGGYSVNVSAGEIGLRVDDPRYQLARTEFEIEDDLQLDVPLEPVDADRARVVGTVTDDEGTTLEDADVRLQLVPDDCDEDERCEERHHRARSSEATTREVETSQGTVEITYEPRVHPYARTTTDEEGRYEARVPEGSYRVSARISDHLPAATTVDVGEGQQVRADLALTPIPPASVTVEGRIVDAEDGDGIEGARVSLDNQRWGTYNATRTDAEGRFQVAIEPGYTTVRIDAGDSYRVPCEAEAHAEDEDDGARPRDCDPHRERSTAYLPLSTTIQPDADERVTLDEALEPEPEPDARIEGWVTNASSGEAVPGATLSFANEETREWGRAQAGEDGSFAIDLDRGYYTVRVHADGYFAETTNLRVEGEIARETFELTPGEPAEGGCCRVYHHDRVAESDAGGGDAAAEPGAPPPSEGEETYRGGAGELGAPPATTSEGPIEALDAVPAAGGLAAAVGLAAATAIACVRRRGLP